MLRILAKTAASMARIGGSIPSGHYADVDLSTWELVNASQSDGEDLCCSFDEEDATGVCDCVLTLEEVDSYPIRSEYGGAGSSSVTPCDVISVDSISTSPPMTLPVEMTFYNYHPHAGDGASRDATSRDVDEDDGVGYDYDDELVPWKLKSRFSKQRLRKLGKRGGPNPSKSKTMPFYYNRPGCLYGKHGFGVQHCFI